ncbi:hypothetical protein DOK67_0001298 [Enterococcus sp. DIV0212c]|uniref:leucine-rich repeat domain-containing protein n=1 Tax=Enterococcus sp. DIV0212c TaxID=2230867 RepID=UPI001A9B5A79|nr:leucine-rich repeat domain-containing protein [Enterococcus sp. DIV0212c]
MEKKKELKWLISIVLTMLLVIGNISSADVAKAEEGVTKAVKVEQVDINIASSEELQKISGIGTVLAQRIIDTRPFASLDELSKVKGIGAGTLKKIKEQGLAYVDQVLGTIAEVFPDPNFASEIATNLNRDISSTIKQSDLDDIGGLYLKNVNNIEGIQHIRNLLYLQIREGQIENFTPIAAVKKLELLEIEHYEDQSYINLNGVENLSNLGILLLNGIQNADGFDKVSNLSSLERLIIFGKRNGSYIYDFAGFDEDKLPKLNQLWLTHTPVKSLAPIYKLNHLKTLELEYTSREDKQPLDFDGIQQLDNLTTLKVNFPENILEVGPIGGLKSLEKLDFGSFKSAYKVPVTGLSELSKLDKVKELRIYETHIDNVDWMSSLKQLEKLSLVQNRVKDVSALANLTMLKELWFSDNIVEDVSAVSSLNQLERLDLNAHAIKKIPSLTSLSKLKNLNLSGEKLIDTPENTASLSSLPSLQNFSLLMKITNKMDWLLSAEKLESLRIGYNRIQDLSHLSELSKLKSLKTLSVNSNKIEDISALSKFEQLESLDIAYNSINDLSAISNLTKLKVLSINDNGVQDILVLSNFNQLEKLYMHNNPITDVTPLSQLINLQFLRSSGTKITDYSPLDGLKCEIYK